MRKIILLLLLSLGFLMPAVAADVPKKLVIQSGKVKNTFMVEVADSDLSREKGLMMRDHLDADKGMLFLFKNEKIENFWMKNTLIPLDMIFIEKGGRISKVHAMAKPHDLTMISSETPVVAVIEIKGGQAAKRNIKAGNKVISPIFAK